MKENGGNDFKTYLVRYLEDIYPKNVKVKEVYREKINLDKYDFSTANAWLIASVNGRFTDTDLNRYGQNRFGQLCKAKIGSCDKVVTYQTSSIGKLNPKFMSTLKNQFVGKLADGEKRALSMSGDIQDNFRIIFPTDGYV